MQTLMFKRYLIVSVSLLSIVITQDSQRVQSVQSFCYFVVVIIIFRF